MAGTENMWPAAPQQQSLSVFTSVVRQGCLSLLNGEVEPFCSGDYFAKTHRPNGGGIQVVSAVVGVVVVDVVVVQSANRVCKCD